jgi:hypothetical protein
MFDYLILCVLYAILRLFLLPTRWLDVITSGHLVSHNKISNNDLYMKSSITKQITHRHLRWLGHVLRMARIAKSPSDRHHQAKENQGCQKPTGAEMCLKSWNR